MESLEHHRGPVWELEGAKTKPSPLFTQKPTSMRMAIHVPFLPEADMNPLNTDTPALNLQLAAKCHLPVISTLKLRTFLLIPDSRSLGIQKTPSRVCA